MTYRAPLIVNSSVGQIQELAVADGLSVAGNVLTGAILASTYLYANGTPFNGGGGAGYFIASGNSNVSITVPDGPVNTAISGVGIVTVNQTGQYVTGVSYASTALQAPLISATGNIAAAGYVLGNGAFLSGVITSVANINNGNSNVSIDSDNANVTVGVNGTANVVTITPTALVVASSAGNVISTNGNIVAGYLYGNGALLTGIITSVANINNGNSNVSISSANANVTITVSTVANVVTVTPTLVSATGNIYGNGFISVAGNILGNGIISTSGNVTGNYFIGNANPGSTSAAVVGYMGLPISTTTSNYTLVLADQGELIYNGSGSSITVTVPSNANVAFPVGAVIAFAQYGGGIMTIAGQAGVTLALVGTSATGNRTLTSVGMASATQVATNTWLITGTGVT